MYNSWRYLKRPSLIKGMLIIKKILIIGSFTLLSKRSLFKSLYMHLIIETHVVDIYLYICLLETQSSLLDFKAFREVLNLRFAEFFCPPLKPSGDGCLG